MSRVEHIRNLWEGASAFVVDGLACGDWSFTSDMDREEEMEFQHEDGHPLNASLVNFYVYGERCLNREYMIDDQMVDAGKCEDGSLVIDYYGTPVTITPLFTQRDVPDAGPRVIGGDKDVELDEDVESAWIGVDQFSVYLKRTDEGIVVDLFARGREMEDAIAGTYAFEVEATEEERAAG